MSNTQATQPASLEATENLEQVPNTSPSQVSVQSVNQMSGPRKAAILCIALGDEIAIDLFKHLTEMEVEAITREIAAIDYVPPEVGDRVVEEFHNIFLARSYVSSGGIDFAKRLLIKTLGPDGTKRMLDKIVRSLEASIAFETMRKITPQQISKLLQNEHSQTIALVLTHLDASTAADTLSFLPENQRADLIMRMAHLQSIPQDVIRRVSLVLEQKLKNIGDMSQQPVGGVRAVAELCNRLDRDAARKVLEEIELSDPGLALSIRNLMVTFDDLLLIDDMGIREILKYVDKKVLSMALKGAVPEIQQRFFSNMSGRAVELMKEEIEYMGQVKMKDVFTAQREIVNVLRELDEKGIISLGGSEESYVA
ncbi:MAG: flagellar motor switch protein FliG [Acidobacteriota bacterium]